MTRKVIQALLGAAVIVAIGWFVVAPSPEPLIAVFMGVVGVLSLRLSEPPGVHDSVPGDAGGGGGGESPRRTRVAVLPLQNIAGQPGQEYLAEGLTEEVISVLSRVGGLQVIARSSVAPYRDRDRPLPEIGRELGVGTVLEGSVRVADGVLRVSVRLIDVASQAHLWAEDYDRDLSGIFAVQRDVAQQVARALQVSVLEDEAARLEEVPTADLEAYDLFLLGRHDLNRRTEEGVRRSIRRFRAAVEKDASFGAAHAGIADAYVLAMIGYAGIPREEAVREARAASARAIETQETLSDAHTSRGFVLMNVDRDWAGAEAEFRRALELNPSDARAYQWFAQCHSYQGRFEEAIPLVRKARQLDPRSPLIATEEGWPYLYLGRDDDALACFRRALDLDPEFALAHFNIGNILELQGDAEAALEKYQHAIELSGGAPVFTAFAARALALVGRRREAMNELERVAAQVDEGTVSPVYVARIHEALDDPEAALSWLERAVARNDPMTVGLRTRWLALHRLEGLPRYEAILEDLDA